MNRETSEKENLSIRDVAAEAQVSIATVSRVLNGSGYVSEKTQEKVRDAIERMGFVPNVAARGMRMNRMPIIGFIVDNIKNEYFSDLATNLQRFFLEQGYFVIICATESSPKLEQLSVDMLVGQKASGIVMIARDRVSARIPDSMPLVCIDCEADLSRKLTAIVESDNRDGGYQATKKLIDCGCRKIALFTGPEEAYTSRKRSEGYFAALMDAGIPIDLRRVFHFEGFDYSNGQNLVERLLESGIECDGIFAICDYVVQGSLDALRERGIDVPGQIRVVGFDDLFMAQCNGKKLTTVHQCSEQVARTAADILLEMAAGREPAQKKVMIPTYLIARETT